VPVTANAIARQSRSGAMGAIAPPPIPKVAPTFFRLIKLLMCSLSQRNTSVQINETAQGTFPTSAFSRT